MEIIGIPTPPIPLSVDHLSSNSSTPYMSASSSPQHSRPRPGLNFFYSAPTSPRSHASHSLFDDVYDEYRSDSVTLLSHTSCQDFAAVPFDWELKPGVAKVSNALDENRREQTTTTTQYGLMEKGHQDDTEVKEEVTRKEGKEEDYQFDFSGQLDLKVMASLSSADELFDGGKIRPLKLKPPPSYSPMSPKSPKSTMSKVKDAFSMSPKHRRNMSDFGPEHDPFEAAIRNARKSQPHTPDECEWGWDSNRDGNNEAQNRGRGRDRAKPVTSANTNVNMNKRGSNSRKGISRSLSPLRVSEFALLQHQDQNNLNDPGNSTGLFGRGSSSASSKKWRLKDLFLFRSASEGHYKDTQSYSKRWSFRSSNMVSGPGSGSVSGSESGSVSKRRGQASAHETIYTKNRAVAEELKRKTVLPYRHNGLLACLGFSPVLPQFSYAFPNTPV